MKITYTCSRCKHVFDGDPKHVKACHVCHGSVTGVAKNQEKEGLRSEKRDSR
jgi:hypothetical protein